MVRNHKGENRDYYVQLQYTDGHPRWLASLSLSGARDTAKLMAGYPDVAKVWLMVEIGPYFGDKRHKCLKRYK
jgi:hypothetical protein